MLDVKVGVKAAFYHIRVLEGVNVVVWGVTDHDCSRLLCCPPILLTHKLNCSYLLMHLMLTTCSLFLSSEGVRVPSSYQSGRLLVCHFIISCGDGQTVCVCVWPLCGVNTCHVCDFTPPHSPGAFHLDTSNNWPRPRGERSIRVMCPIISYCLSESLALIWIVR